MPTGYTADVANGKITDLAAFAMQCARGMGALVMMRDDPWDAPIPERFEPRTAFHDENIAVASEELQRLRGLTVEACETEAAAAYDQAVKSRDEYAAAKEATRCRYGAMLAQVSAWSCRAEGLKTLMLSQLGESIEFDCGGMENYPWPVRQTGEAWRQAAMANAAKDAAYHTEERAKEVARTEDRNRWLADLRASLPGSGRTNEKAIPHD